MRHVLDAVRRPMIRSAVVALSLAGLMVFGGTALARLPGESRAADVPTSGDHDGPGTGQQDGQAARDRRWGGGEHHLCWWHRHASGVHQPGSANLQDRVAVQVVARRRCPLSPNGSVELTASYVGIFNVTHGAGYGFGESFDVMTSSGTFQHYEAAFNVHELGSDCVTHVAIMSN